MSITINTCAHTSVAARRAEHGAMCPLRDGEGRARCDLGDLRRAVVALPAAEISTDGTRQ